MAAETGKQRSQRIEIDYYRKRSGLDRWRQLCIIGATLFGVGFAMVAILTTDDRSSTAVSLVSTGELARVHQSFENRCDACHRPFAPINPRDVGDSLSFVGIDKQSSLEHLESACSRCHIAGSHHRDSMQASWQDDDQNCAFCHSDHRGRMRDLTQISNQKCVHCHDKLERVCAGQTKIQSEVTGFTAAAHGDFQSLSVEDPGRVKFDHAQHMLPGQVDAGKRGGMTLDQLPSTFRDAYQPLSSDDNVIQLRCADCHRYSGIPGDEFVTVADQEIGRHFEAIRFDQHCSACHALTAGITTEDAPRLPHAIPWPQTRLLLAATIDGARRVGQARSPNDDSQSIAQPGTGFGNAATANPQPVSSDSLDAAVAVVTEQCKKCHIDEDLTDEAINNPNARAPMIPSRWLKKGIYDHAAHREIDCRHCHEQTVAPAPEGPANDHNVVMIAGIESCSGCHRHSGDASESPEELANHPHFGDMPTWGSDSCTLCHRYHSHVPEVAR